MIPTALVAGLLLGRWWWTFFLVGLAWALILASDGICRGACSVSAFALGCANAAVGVAIHQGILFATRRLNREPAER